MTKPGSLIQREFTIVTIFVGRIFLGPPAIHYPTLYKHFLLLNAAMAAPNVHNTYIYHPFSTRLNGQIHTKMTTSTRQILTSLIFSVLDINRANKSICTICTTQTNSVANSTHWSSSSSVSRLFLAWPDDWGNMFLRNIGGFRRTTRCYILRDRSLQFKLHLQAWLFDNRSCEVD